MDIFSKSDKGLIFFDGGMGSLLQARGLKPGQLPDTWNCDNPAAVKDCHLSYLRSGADIINTNTFGSNRARLGHRLEEVVKAGVRIAKEAVSENGGGFVALDIGPTGRLFEPYGDMSFNEAYDLFAEVVKLGAAENPDLINIETMGDISEARAAVLAAKENCSLPVFVSVAFGDNGRLMMGADAITAACSLEALGADAVGLNCGVGPEAALKHVSQLASYLSVPVIACPNAGLPRLCDGKTYFDVTPDEFAETAVSLVEAGARIIGGCCGTTPEFISALRRRAENMTPRPFTEKSGTFVCSSLRSLEIGDSPIYVNRDSHPENNAEAAAALLDGDVSVVVDAIADAGADGADIVSVCAAFRNADENKLLPLLVSDAQALCRAPIMITYKSASAAERSVRIYGGRALICPIDGGSAEAYALAVKYGAVIVLPRSDIPAAINAGVKLSSIAVDTSDGLICAKSTV